MENGTIGGNRSLDLNLIDLAYIKGVLMERRIILEKVGSKNYWEIKILDRQIKILELWKQKEKEFLLKIKKRY